MRTGWEIHRNVEDTFKIFDDTIIFSTKAIKTNMEFPHFSHNSSNQGNSKTWEKTKLFDQDKLQYETTIHKPIYKNTNPFTRSYSIKQAKPIKQEELSDRKT